MTISERVHESVDGLLMPRRLAAVIAICTAVFITVLDGAMLTIALPFISRDLGVSASQSIWIVNAYQLVIVICILPAVLLADRFGYAQLFRAGIGIYICGAWISAQTNSFEPLVLARVLQGFGAAAIMCASSALLRAVYPANLFGTGVAINTAVATMSAASGPTLGSLILSWSTDWHGLFLFFIPLGLICAVCTVALPTTARHRRQLGGLSVVLNIVCLGGGVFALAMLGKNPLFGVILLVLMALAWVAWLRHESILMDPLLPLDLFRIPRFSYAIAASVSMFCAQSTSLVALPFLFQETRGMDILHAGLLMTVWPASAAITSTFVIRISRRVSVAGLCATGALLLISGLLWIILVPLNSSDFWLAIGLMLGGLAVGLFQAPNMHAILTAGPRARAGAAGSIQAIARVGGTTLGASLAGLCFVLFSANGAGAALGAAILLATVACVVNVHRRRFLGLETNA